MSHSSESLDDTGRVFPTFEMLNEFPTVIASKIRRGSIADWSSHFPHGNALMYGSWHI